MRRDMSNPQVYSGLSSIGTPHLPIKIDKLTGSPQGVRQEENARSLPRNFFVLWFKRNGRDFPWRSKDISPFAVLVTEILLRQTAASAVGKLWREFMASYPDAPSLEKARRSSLVRAVKVLGFGNQRAEALQHASQYLIQNHNGLVPQTLDELLKVPHIGNYAARAILCFAFGRKIEIVDTNIL